MVIMDNVWRLASVDKVLCSDIIGQKVKRARLVEMHDGHLSRSDWTAFME